MDREESVIKIDFEGLICIFYTQNKMYENYPKITKDVKTRERAYWKTKRQRVRSVEWHWELGVFKNSPAPTELPATAPIRPLKAPL